MAIYYYKGRNQYGFDVVYHLSLWRLHQIYTGKYKRSYRQRIPEALTSMYSPVDLTYDLTVARGYMIANRNTGDNKVAAISRAIKEFILEEHHKGKKDHYRWWRLLLRILAGSLRH